MKYFETFGATLEQPIIMLKPEFGAYGPFCCDFCSLGAKKNRKKSIPLTASLKKEILQEFESLLKNYPMNIALQSCDIFAYPDILALLDRAHAYHKKITLISPIPLLSDKKLVDRIKRYASVIDTTFLTFSPRTYARMTHNPRAYQLMQKALTNLMTAYIPYTISIVVTRYNVKQLAQTIIMLHDRFRCTCFSIRTFFIDSPVVGSRTLCSQFPSYECILEQLNVLDKKLHDNSTLHIDLVHFPVCQLQHAHYSHVRLHIVHSECSSEGQKMNRSSRCTPCPDKSRCAGIHPSYRRMYGPVHIDNKKTTALLATFSGNR